MGKISRKKQATAEEEELLELYPRITALKNQLRQLIEEIDGKPYDKEKIQRTVKEMEKHPFIKKFYKEARLQPKATVQDMEEKFTLLEAIRSISDYEDEKKSYRSIGKKKTKHRPTTMKQYCTWVQEWYLLIKDKVGYNQRFKVIAEKFNKSPKTIKNVIENSTLMVEIEEFARKNNIVLKK